MKAVTFRWSGDHKTIVDLGHSENTVVMYLRIAIDHEKAYFREQVKSDPCATIRIARIKNEIRKIEELADVISMADSLTDPAKAAKAAYSMIMP